MLWLLIMILYIAGSMHSTYFGINKDLIWNVCVSLSLLLTWFPDILIYKKESFADRWPLSRCISSWWPSQIVSVPWIGRKPEMGVSSSGSCSINSLTLNSFHPSISTRNCLFSARETKPVLVFEAAWHCSQLLHAFSFVFVPLAL